MAIRYEVDGDIFREIDVKFLAAYVKESLIVARTIQTDAAGNKVELFQLNDGRWFSRALAPQRQAAIVRESTSPARIPQRVTDR